MGNLALTWMLSGRLGDPPEFELTLSNENCERLGVHELTRAQYLKPSRGENPFRFSGYFDRGVVHLTCKEAPHQKQ
jgi:hypothetical protein